MIPIPIPIPVALNSESRVSCHVFQFWYKHLLRLFVSQYMQQTVFHNGNQFTLYDWNF